MDSATMESGIAGTGVTLQMFLLGAPDVALTQFTVEALSVIVMMMVTTATSL